MAQHKTPKNNPEFFPHFLSWCMKNKIHAKNNNSFSEKLLLLSKCIKIYTLKNKLNTVDQFL
jgi:ribosome-associated toxin RatA of RatAB toxin-antitoxin module